MISVVMLSVIMLSVMAPLMFSDDTLWISLIRPEFTFLLASSVILY
jgi:hypothetical protein